MAPSFLSEALRKPLGPLLMVGGNGARAQARRGLFERMPDGQAYASSAAEWRETLAGREARAPAREGNGGAMAYIVVLCFIEILTLSKNTWCNDIINLRICADLRQKLQRVHAVDHLCDLTSGIVEVAEDPRPLMACLHTEGLKPLPHPLLAEIAFLHCPCFGVRVACTVRTGLDARLASDARVLVNPDDAVGLLPGSPGGTTADAGRVLAVHAYERIVGHADVRENTVRPGSEDRVVNHVEGQLVIHLAGNRTGMASDAPPRVHDHYKSRHTNSPSVRFRIAKTGQNQNSIKSENLLYRR